MAKQLYDYWFVQFDFPDENGKPYKSSGGKMVWNKQLKQEIPNGWEYVHAGEISKIVTGKEDANFSCADGKYRMSRGMLYIKPDEFNVFYWEENNTIPAAAIENGNDVSYLFAHNTSSGNQLDRWKFIIEGSYTPSGGVKTDFAIERFISNSDKDMVAGKAYRLPTSGWSNVE